jgi:hypothetical protein
MYHSYQIGSRGMISDASKKVGRITQAGIARTGVTERTDKLSDAVKAAIDDLQLAHPFAASEKNARRIRPEVLRRLGIVETEEETTWPGVMTIKRELIKLKKKSTR